MRENSVWFKTPAPHTVATLKGHLAAFTTTSYFKLKTLKQKEFNNQI